MASKWYWLELLGCKVEDRVTGMKGIVTSIAYELYGCIQAVVHPGLDKDGKTKDQLWFDVSRLKILNKKPVMKVPDFDNIKQSNGEQGSDKKPLIRSI